MTTFSGLLLRWKASVYKIIWIEMIAFLVAFFFLSFVYRYGLKGEHKVNFEELCEYAYRYRSTLPISFILGFYVTVIYNRWWSQFNAIPRPDAIAANVAAHIKGSDESSKLLRRTMVRYVNLAATLCYCAISTSVKKRFPTQSHLIKAGFLMEQEAKMLNEVRSEHPKYWIPCAWYINLLRKADSEKKISNAPGMKTLLDELNRFREKCDGLYSFDWIEVPVVYTQVVTLAVYSYFVASLFSHQFLRDASEWKYYRIDLYIPFSCLMELVFYIGWLKVAEKIMDPFGDDEHDFDMNVIVDRNWQVSYLTVDNIYDLNMPLLKDPYFQEASIGLPHTKASSKMPVSKSSTPWMGSADAVKLSDRDMENAENGVQQTSPFCPCFGKRKPVRNRKPSNNSVNVLPEEQPKDSDTKVEMTEQPKAPVTEVPKEQPKDSDTKVPKEQPKGSDTKVPKEQPKDSVTEVPKEQSKSPEVPKEEPKSPITEVHWVKEAEKDAGTEVQKKDESKKETV
ncbi:bestrophin-4-like [Amphiura filiformis]|uniref:bestrophin-4-like n=1 Tax=Amphiura filiformis TaxID=82378 RepID=UPI003B220870